MEKTPFDIYVDDFSMELGAYGAALTLRTGNGPRETALTHGKVRMSIEHMKVLTYQMFRLVQQVEHEQVIVYPLSEKALKSLNINDDAWMEFWRK